MAIRLVEPATEAYEYPLLIRSLLNGIAQFDGREIVSANYRFSYHDFEQRVHRLASMLAALGVEPGSTVAVMDWDSHRFLECYFAIPMMGAIIQTVNVRLAPDQVAYTLQQSGAEYLICHSDFLPLLDAIRPALHHIKACVFINDELSPMSTPDGFVGEYEELVMAASAAYDFPNFNENAIATTFHTTGTTGAPKAVVFSHRQLVLHTLAIGTALCSLPPGESVSRDDVYMPMTPMFHVHAWGMPFLATMLGMKQVYPGRYDPEQLLMLKETEGVTFSHCVPTILRMLLDAAKAKGVSLAPWRMIIGGSALAPSLRAEAAKAGVFASAGYGMSETGPVISLARTTSAGQPADLCRAGFPAPLVEARTSAENGKDEGELLLRAPWLTLHYPGSPEATAALWQGGWMHTEDVARFQPDGALIIVDRLKDVIKTGGEWVSSALLEELTMEHALVAEAAYIGVEDARWGERPHGFIVGVPGQVPPDIDDIRAFLQPHVDQGAISRYALPDHITVIQDMPRTSVGKIDKKALRELL